MGVDTFPVVYVIAGEEDGGLNCVEIPWSATPEFAGGFVIGWIACRMILNRLGLQVIHQPSSPAPACATHTLESFSSPAPVYHAFASE